MNVDAYFSRIRPHVKGCPDVVIKEALLLVLRYICYRANIWPYSTSLYFVKGIDEYDLDPLPGTEVATVQAIARPDGTRLDSRDALPVSMTAGTAQFYRHYERNLITVYAAFLTSFKSSRRIDPVEAAFTNFLKLCAVQTNENFAATFSFPQRLKLLNPSYLLCLAFPTR
ncbi:hypothetical protein ACH42_11050 [Endozoicomonas sp. (ex Bugula neritina AB1)]|nr:hypothetical protein ACH42_11050 [Endozoicomonas sp. (ex Bugula neritina AB1)]